MLLLLHTLTAAVALARALAVNKEWPPQTVAYNLIIFLFARVGTDPQLELGRRLVKGVNGLL